MRRRLVLALLVGLAWAPPAFAATRTWDGGGGDANASTAANWSADTAPVAADDVVFDGTSTKDCTWDLALSVASVSLNSGYTGTVTETAALTATSSMTISAGAWNINSGITLTSSGATFTLNSGGTLSGTGTINRTNTTAPTLSGTINMQSGTTFGTFRYTLTSNATIPAATYTSDLSLRGGSGAGTRTFTVGAGTLTVAGNLDLDKATLGSTMLLTNATNNTNLTIGGNWDDAGQAGLSTYTAGTETVTYNGSGATGTVTLDIVNFVTTWNNVTFNESGTTFNITEAATITGALTVGSGTTLDIGGELVMTASGSSIDNSGTIDETGVDQDGDPVKITHPATSCKLTDKDGNEVAGYALKDDLLYVTLVDEDENLNGTAADTANGVTVSISGGDSETMSGTYILTETGAKTETFRNTTGLPTALLQAGQTGTANNGVLELLATDTISVAYTDGEDSTDNAASDTAATQTVGASLLTIGQSLSSTRVSPGQPVAVTATLTNNQTTNALTFRVEDTLPVGFVFQAGSAALDGVAMTPTVADQTLTFSNITVNATASRTLRLLLIPGSLTPGEYINRMLARINPVISNVSQVTITVTPDPLFTLSTLLGKVFVDANGNGRQDRDEPGLADIRLATEEGVTVTTDTAGRFHLPDLLPGRHLLKLDRTTLPPGASLTTEHTRLITATDGSLSKVNFGVRLGREARSQQSAISNQQSAAISLPKELPVTDLSVTQLPAVARPILAIRVEPPILRIEQTSLAEPAVFRIDCNYPFFVKAWIIAIATDDEQLLQTLTGAGPPPASVEWDGRLEVGELLAGRSYRYRLFVWNGEGRQDFTSLQRFTVELYQPPATAVSKTFP
ncbi:MAG: DUF11 domain-containing protein [Candidatus Omnitrophica bacterium]|nr:DUF11 domain-containing protein [Candidatus Omnitrophota bacterium]